MTSALTITPDFLSIISMRAPLEICECRRCHTITRDLNEDGLCSDCVQEILDNAERSVPRWRLQ